MWSKSWNRRRCSALSAADSLRGAPLSGDAALRNGRCTMNSLLKGGVLWLLGVPVVGIVLAWAIGWI